MRSCSSWTSDVDTLLPRTDVIAFNRPGGEMLLVPWEAAREVVADLMEEIDLAPIRYRVRAFPDDRQWEVLRQFATT